MKTRSCECIGPCGIFRCLRCTHTWRAYPNGSSWAPGAEGRPECRACKRPTQIEWLNYEGWRATHDTWSTPPKPTHPYRNLPAEAEGEEIMRVKLWQTLLERAVCVEGERLNRILRRLELLWEAMTEEERSYADGG